MDRKERNKISAKKFREKKLKEIDKLNSDLDTLAKDNTSQITYLTSLKQDRETLEKDLIYVRKFVETLLKLSMSNRE